MALPYLCRQMIFRRRRQTLIIILIVVIVFCFMQFLSLLKLNIFREKQNEGPIPKRFIKIDPNANFDEKDDHDPKQEHPFYDKWRHMELPHGVHVDDAQSYAPNKNNTFACIHTRTLISMSQVNDDYCDCEDSTDEPGTSACPSSRFYCKYQIPHEDPLFLPGSQVNDGICDCCDGSDEWQGHMVPEHMHLSERVQAKTVHQAPCENRCKQVVEHLEEEDQVRRQGNRLRREYVEHAKNLPPGKRMRYGPEGVFYKLASQCFTFNTKEYEFTVCPFSSVKQQKSPQPAMSLGHNPSWEKQTPGDHVLLMRDGDAKLCPLGHPRKTKIHFYCGLEDKVSQITENERCFYSVQFSSPAACS